ncbi:hypothetical protein [Nocardioides pinisoli]|uniref:Integral membrane protein n=1 Tax=Nocardioides pinisoli TaxID=2950279 RepID=A0ABT1KWF1_9ACTN|nr:hypothetical protein [Nocardioides pinisoli]MCP3421343.1 hypothetical protein [Nocardioides pinisoli]
MTTTHPTRTPTTTTPGRRGIPAPVARPFLLADAVTTGANGLAYAVAGGLLADWFGAPDPLVRSLGGFLLLVAVAVGVLATRRPVPRRGVAALAALNVVWVVASVDYALLGGLTTLGVVWTVVQAVVVGVFAAGQVWLVRKG